MVFLYRPLGRISFQAMARSYKVERVQLLQLTMSFKDAWAIQRAVVPCRWLAPNPCNCATHRPLPNPRYCNQITQRASCVIFLQPRTQTLLLEITYLAHLQCAVEPLSELIIVHPLVTLKSNALEIRIYASTVDNQRYRLPLMMMDVTVIIRFVLRSHTQHHIVLLARLVSCAKAFLLFVFLHTLIDNELHSFRNNTSNIDLQYQTRM